jgi:ArsR family transcriptional regulator, lead/cadmium/zinc/bismuth-responsive transcriptional repressor
MPAKYKGLDKSVEYLKILAEENRLKILCILGENETCVCEIWRMLGIPQNLASHHLKVLKDNKLIKSRKDGLKVFYSLNRLNIAQNNNSLNKLLKQYE